MLHLVFNKVKYLHMISLLMQYLKQMNHTPMKNARNILFKIKPLKLIFKQLHNINEDLLIFDCIFMCKTATSLIFASDIIIISIIDLWLKLF